MEITYKPDNKDEPVWLMAEEVDGVGGESGYELARSKILLPAPRHLMRIGNDLFAEVDTG